MSATGELVSPELVLVDPRLAIGARALLSEREGMLARLGPQSPPNQPEPLLPVWNVDPASSADEGISAALRRITELSEVEPPNRRTRRLVSLVAVTAAWGSVALFVANLELGLYAPPF